MPIYHQQSSILTDPELLLLASQFSDKKHCYFAVYSFQVELELDNTFFYLSDTLDHLILILSASQRGSALILPEHVKSHALLDALLELLNFRADIQIFWIGEMPSMDIALPRFEHCQDQLDLLTKINEWQQRSDYIFKQWLQQYRIAFITDNHIKNSLHRVELKSIGVRQVEYFDASSTAYDINNKQLLVINLNVEGLRFVDLLNDLANREAFPILILFGELSANRCQAAYNLARNKGFSILACLTSAPNKKKWQNLLHTLFLKVYLKHWVTSPTIKIMAYGIYNIDEQNLESYFCLYGMSQAQIAQLSATKKVQKIINAQSLLDWFPHGIRREIRNELAKTLNSDFKQIDICIENPEQILMTSVLYSALVMAGLSGCRIYWLVHHETPLLSDTLKNFPISDILLSEELSHQLIAAPSDELLDFIKQAKQQKIRLGVTLQKNKIDDEIITLYGVEFVLNQQDYLL